MCDTRNHEYQDLLAFVNSVTSLFIVGCSIKIFTNQRSCQAFVERSGQSSLVASTCMNRESRTNRSKDALRSNRFRRSHRSEWIFGHCSIAVGRKSHQWRMRRQLASVSIVDSFGSLELEAPKYWSWSMRYSHWDKRFRQRACWPSVATTNNRHPSSGIAIASNASPRPSG